MALWLLSITGFFQMGDEILTSLRTIKRDLSCLGMTDREIWSTRGLILLFCQLWGMTGLEQRKLYIFIPDSEFGHQQNLGGFDYGLVLIMDGLTQHPACCQQMGHTWLKEGKGCRAHWESFKLELRGKRIKSGSLEIRLGIVFHFLKDNVLERSFSLLSW